MKKRVYTKVFKPMDLLLSIQTKISLNKYASIVNNEKIKTSKHLVLNLIQGMMGADIFLSDYTEPFYGTLYSIEDYLSTPVAFIAPKTGYYRVTFGTSSQTSMQVVHASFSEEKTPIFGAISNEAVHTVEYLGDPNHPSFFQSCLFNEQIKLN